MKAAYFERHGGLAELQYGDLPAPPLGPGDVRVKVKACALNHLDIFVREGWPGLQLPLPHVGGTDLAGVVAEVAPDAEGSGVRVGDEVLVNPGLSFAAGPDGEQAIPKQVSIVGETRWGGLAQECVVPATHVVPRPAGMEWEVAAALPLCSMTAMQMVRRKGRVRAGSRVLVVGAGGGVASMALQVAKADGAWVCATTGGADKVAKVRALGADVVVDYKAEADWSKAAYLTTQRKGFDVVIDSTGQATFGASVRSLAHGGRLVVCGATTGGLAQMDLRHVFWRQLSILGSTMGVPADLDAAIGLWRAGKLRVPIDSVFPLSEARAAQERMEKGLQFGKIVLRP